MYLHADSERCSGCRACLLACSLHLFGENNPRKAALVIIPHFPTPGGYEVRTCLQCGTCARACPMEAVHRVDGGGYAIDSDACCYCGVCVAVCPEQVIGVHLEVSAPYKCDLCGECVSFCGMDVLSIIDEEGR